MAKKVEGTFADAWKPAEVGDSLKATYLGRQEAEGSRGNFNAYHFREKETGKRWSVSGANLNTIMPQIPKKTDVVVYYRGMEPTKRGEMRLFEVEVPDNVVLLDPFDDDGED